MIRISSEDTFLVKWIAPIFVVGGVSICISYPLLLSYICPYQNLCSEAFYIPLPIKLFSLPALAFIFYQCVISSRYLVDEVWDCGEALLIKNRGKEQKVALSEIATYRLNANGKGCVTLTLYQPGYFGKRIDFIPLRGGCSIAPGYGGSKDPSVAMLPQRIVRAQRKHATD